MYGSMVSCYARSILDVITLLRILIEIVFYHSDYIKGGFWEINATVYAMILLEPKTATLYLQSNMTVDLQLKRCRLQFVPSLPANDTHFIYTKKIDGISQFVNMNKSGGTCLCL